MVAKTTHNSGSSTSEISKKDALQICSKCKKMDSAKCIFSDIEGSRKDTIIVPKCMVSLNKVNEESSFMNANSLPKNDTGEGERTFKGYEERMHVDDSFTKSDTVRGEQTVRSPITKKVRSPIGGVPGINEITLVPLDWEIIEYLKDDMHVRGIANGLGRSQSTITYRVKRMEKAGLLFATKGVYGTKLYKISKDLFTQMSESLVHNEERYQTTDFTAHAVAFKYPIISGNQPTSSAKHSMKNWSFYDFTFKNHVIRSTPKSIVIFLNLELSSGSVTDINLKYMDVAQPYIADFAKQYNLSLGTPTLYRDPHYTIEDTAISQLITEQGEFKTKGMGISFDKSKSTGDLEMDEKSARAFEFTLNKLPYITDKINDKLYQLNQTTTDEFTKTTDEFTKTHTTLEQISADVNGLYVLMQIKHEYDKLRIDYKEMLDLMKSQTETQHTTKTSVTNSMQIYG